jgi:thioredoxin-dependent peroxiredoxin
MHRENRAKTTKGRHVSPLVSGIRAPAFRLIRDGGDTVSLLDFAQQKLVVFFFPRAGTEGCNREAAAFSALADEFSMCGTALLGVSADPIATLERFKARLALTIPLASDPEHEMLTAYGVWGEKKLYGRIFMGITRTTVLIDRHGIVARVWPKVKIDRHAEEVLAAARGL